MVSLGALVYPNFGIFGIGIIPVHDLCICVCFSVLFNCECLVTPNKQYIFELLVIEVTVKLYHQLLMLKQVPSLKLLVRNILSTIRENIYCVLDCNNLSDIKYFYPLIVTGIVGITDN